MTVKYFSIVILSILIVTISIQFSSAATNTDKLLKINGISNEVAKEEVDSYSVLKKYEHDEETAESDTGADTMGAIGKRDRRKDDDDHDDDDKDDDDDDKSLIAAIIGSVAGLLLVILIIVAFCYCTNKKYCCCTGKSGSELKYPRSLPENRSGNVKHTSPPIPPPYASASSVSQQIQVAPTRPTPAQAPTSTPVVPSNPNVHQYLYPNLNLHYSQNQQPSAPPEFIFDVEEPESPPAYNDVFPYNNENKYTQEPIHWHPNS